MYVNHYSGGGGHWSRTIVFGADSAMYVSVGSTCNLCVEKSSDRAAVLRFNEDGSGKRVFASGLRNAVGLAVNPTTGALWASQNERDNLRPDHEDLPPEEINILTDGGDYGWPYCYGDRVPNPEYNDAARCAHTIPPALEAAGAFRAARHHASSRSRHGISGGVSRRLLVAYHGSWNRDTPTGAKVVRVTLRDGKPVAVEDFITGWQRPNGSAGAVRWTSLVAADGSVLVSDDSGGAIYRVTRRARDDGAALDAISAALRSRLRRSLTGRSLAAQERSNALAGHTYQPGIDVLDYDIHLELPDTGSFLRGDVTISARRRQRCALAPARPRRRADGARACEVDGRRRARGARGERASTSRSTTQRATACSVRVRYDGAVRDGLDRATRTRRAAGPGSATTGRIARDSGCRRSIIRATRRR